MDIKIQRALVSVTDKTGLIEFVRGLREYGVEIISTGGTAKVLEGAGIEIMEISKYTGFPEIMDGRVKTLHPKVHGGILAVRDDPQHLRIMKELDIRPIDMVVVNLYQFENTVAKPDVTLQEAIENIDIGGPTLLRSSAKNFKYVTVVTDPGDYPLVLNVLRENNGATTYDLRLYLAKKVFAQTSSYDRAIFDYLSKLGA